MKKDIVILGINVGENANHSLAHDGGACLQIGNKIVGAIAEERITRQKYCGGYSHAVNHLLKQANLTINNVDIVAVSCYGCEAKMENIGDLGFPDTCKVVLVPSHHLSHACSAYYPSKYKEALVLVADNEGNILGSKIYDDMWKNPMERLSLYWGENSSIELLERDMDQEDEISLGELYANFTKYVGFKTYLNAGKTMALASFGDSMKYDDVRLIELLENGKIKCPMRNNYWNSSEEIIRYFSEYGYELPQQRDPSKESEVGIWQDLASAVQHQLEEALLHKIRYWSNKTGCRSLCLAGGVALNCVANRRILDETPIERMYVQPNCGDQGQGLGNVLYVWYSVLRNSEPVEILGSGVYLGGEYSEQDCLDAISKFEGKIIYRVSNSVIDETAKYLSEGKIIGWFQGRSEWGPRALGNRSILADPRKEEMKDYINNAVKHREGFRQFAPIVQLDDATNYFDVSAPCQSMTIVAYTKKSAYDLIPAVVHVDGTARLQTVEEKDNPRMYDLLKRFSTYSGVPVLINTSFNDNNEPIVETPFDAINSFLRTELDMLIIGDIIIERSAK